MRISVFLLLLVLLSNGTSATATHQRDPEDLVEFEFNTAYTYIIQKSELFLNGALDTRLEGTVMTIETGDSIVWETVTGGGFSESGIPVPEGVNKIWYMNIMRTSDTGVLNISAPLSIITPSSFFLYADWDYHQAELELQYADQIEAGQARISMTDSKFIFELNWTFDDSSKFERKYQLFEYELATGVLGFIDDQYERIVEGVLQTYWHQAFKRPGFGAPDLLSANFVPVMLFFGFIATFRSIVNRKTVDTSVVLRIRNKLF